MCASGTPCAAARQEPRPAMRLSSGDPEVFVIFSWVIDACEWVSIGPDFLAIPSERESHRPNGAATLPSPLLGEAFLSPQAIHLSSRRVQSLFDQRFSSHVSQGVRCSWHNLLSGSEHFVSAHYDVSVASGWKTSAPNLPSGQLSLLRAVQGRLRVARRFPKSFSSP
jgi:hypothetical protein